MQQRITQRALVKVVLVFVALLVSLVLSELAARLIFPPRFYLSFPHVEHIIAASPEVLPGIYHTSFFKLNSFGLRSDELQESDQLRILALGGSTTKSALVDQPFAWPNVVEQKLTHELGLTSWVGNAGQDGLNSRHHLIALEYYLENLPDLDLVIVLAGINDLSYRLAQDDQYEADWSAVETQAALRAETFDFMMPEPSHATHPIRRWHLYQLARRAKQHLVRGSTEVHPEVNEHYQGLRQSRRVAEKITQLPDLTESVAEYRSNLKQLVQLAQASQVRIVLMTQPTLWEREMPPENESLIWMGRVRSGPRTDHYYTPAALTEGIEQYNQALLAVCEEESIPCLDLAALIPKSPEFFYDDCHFNENGSLTVARHVSDFLLHRFRFSLPDMPPVQSP